MWATSQLVRTPCDGKDVVCQSQGGDKNEKEGDGQGEDAEGDGVVEPPGQEKQAGDGKSQKRFDFAGAYRDEAVSFGEHFYGRDEVKEEGHAAEMHAPTPPAVHRE